MAYKIDRIEGIGPSYGRRLMEAGISNTDHLLKHCADAKGRKAAAASTGFSESQLLAWANRADLMRIPGVATQYSDLLEAAGVDTVKEMKNRNAENLAVKMKEINAERRLTRTTPATKVVERWVRDAKTLAPMISH